MERRKRDACASSAWSTDSSCIAGPVAFRGNLDADCQMIVAHLTKSRYPYGNILMLPMLYGCIDSLGPVLLEKFGVGWPSALGYDTYQVAFVFCCLGLAVGVYGS